MEIRVNASQLNVGEDSTMTKDDAIQYVREQVEKAASIFDISPKSATVVLNTEGLQSDPVQKVDIDLVLGSKKIVQSAHSRSIKKAIDRACGPLRRQVQRQKTKVTDGKRFHAAALKHKSQAAAAETDIES